MLNDRPAAARNTLAARGRPPVVVAVELAVLLCLLLLPIFIGLFGLVFMTKVMLLAILALSFDLVWGYAGILSFGQALYFGAGCYTVALLGRDFDLAQAAVTLPAAGLAGGAIAFLMAWFLLLGRKPPSMIFVAIGTLTGSYAAERLVNASVYLGGRNGISGVPFLKLGRIEILDGAPFYYLALATLAAVYLLCRLVTRSQFGLVLAGIRDAERRLLFLGYRVAAFKAMIFTFAGVIAGVAGGLYAYNEGYAGPISLGIQLSTMAVLYVLLGGTGLLAGAVAGAFAIEGMTLVLSDRFPGFWSVLLGLLMLLVLMFGRSGLLGLILPESERVSRFGRRLRRG